jgi:serine/threonine protein kinase
LEIPYQKPVSAGTQTLVGDASAYCPPEVVLARSAGDAVTAEPSLDIWALAVCVYESLVGPVLSRYGGAEEATNCARGEQPYPWEWDEEHVPLKWSCARCRSVVERCFARDPAERPPASEVASALQELMDRMLAGGALEGRTSRKR